MNLFANYVGKTVLFSALVVFVGFIGLDVVFRVISETKNIEANYDIFKVILFEALLTPSRIYQMMPLVGLIACLAGLGSLANSSELVVMRSAGVSTLKLLWLAMRPIFVLMFAAMLVGEYVSPKTEQMAQSLRAEARNKATSNHLSRGLWLRDQEDFVFVNVVQPSGVMFGVTIFSFDEKMQLTSLKQIERATYMGDNWQLENVTTTQVAIDDNGEPQKVSTEQIAHEKWNSQLRPELLKIAVVRPEDLGIRDLWSYVDYLKSQNLNASEYELAFWEKVFYPLVMLSLVLIGISFVFGPLRQVSMGYRVFWGILTGILFKTLQDTLAPLSMVFGFSPMVAMLVPALIAAAIGLFFLLRVR